MDKETLDKINRLTRREFDEKELYTFPVELCNNDIDRDNERFSDEALEQLAVLFVGKTVIADHDPRAANQNARIYDTEVVTDSSRKNALGMPYKYLRASAYMVRTDDNKTLIAEIDGGIKKEVSVSCSAAVRKCSVCGCDKREENPCGHKKGESYSGQLCHTVISDITDAYECSFVAVPAQPDAGVTKKFSKGGIPMNQNEEFKPITTQEELDGIVSSAVEETKKQFEGWLSPEDAAALEKERDDLSASCKTFETHAIRTRVAAESGLPLELADRLSGETEKDIRADAEMLAKYIGKNDQAPAPMFSGESPVSDSKNTAQLEMLRELRTYSHRI